MEDIKTRIDKATRKAQFEKETHTMMLELLESMVPDDRKPIFTLPVKVSRVTDKISDIMMLTSQMDDEVGYAVKTCEFLDRVEEACAAFIEQAKDESNKE